MLTSAGVARVLFPNCSPESTPIELLFSVVTQRFRARHRESMLNVRKGVLDFLHEVIDLMKPDAIVSCCQNAAMLVTFSLNLVRS